MKKGLSIKRLGKSFKYAYNGIKNTIKSEPNMKIHVTMAILVIINAIIFKVSMIEWVILLTLIALVFAAETLNTTFEHLVDMYTKEFNNDAKIVKDTAAGTVLILALASAIIGLMIFIPKLIEVLWKII